MGPPVKGHTGKADNASLTPQKEESQYFLQREPNLLWLTGTLHRQQIPMMLDSGATVCCLAKRCFTGSPYLQNLPLQGYTGQGLLDANGQIMKPFGVIDVHAHFEERLHVKVVPYLHKVSHQHSCVPTVLVDTSAVAKTIKKGTKVAQGTYDFEEFSVLP